MPGKNKDYEVTTEGYKSLGAVTLSAMIQQAERMIETNQNALRKMMQAYKDLTTKGPRV